MSGSCSFQMPNLLKQYVYAYFLTLYVLLLHHNVIADHHQANLHCSANEFVFHHENGTSFCRPFLSCRDVAEMKPIKLLARGVVKNIWLMQWQSESQQLVLAKLGNPQFREDFDANLQNLLFFHGHPRVSQLLGHCGRDTIFSEYHHHGNALNLPNIFFRHKFNSPVDRFSLCIDYAHIIALLHEHLMVMCDSNSLEKTLTQYLINDHFQLILNDLDALPRLDERTKMTKCGHRQVIGDLVAPEQQWPYLDRPFNDSLMPSYTEKVDIWKIPDVCHWILDQVALPSFARHLLHFIHSQCKLTQPQGRPTAPQLLRFYQLINRLL